MDMLDHLPPNPAKIARFFKIIWQPPYLYSSNLEISLKVSDIYFKNVSNFRETPRIKIGAKKRRNMYNFVKIANRNNQETLDLNERRSAAQKCTKMVDPQQTRRTSIYLQ